MSEYNCPTCEDTGMVGDDFCECVAGRIRRTVRGSIVRVTRIDEQGNPVGDMTTLDGVIDFTVSGNEEHDEPVDLDLSGVTTVVIPGTLVGRYTMALMLGHVWPGSVTMLDMGAEWEFDYADLPSDEQTIAARITRCYEIAAHALVSMDAVWARAEAEHLPMPEVLIHGLWSSPEDRSNPIGHAWVLLDDGRIWEPISRTICDAESFMRYTQCRNVATYNAEAARINMVRTGHYGTWH